MGQKPILNGMYGRKGLRALLIALTMLVVVTAGAATAESAHDAQTLENELMTLEAAQEIETDYLLSDPLLIDGDVDDNIKHGISPYGVCISSLEYIERFTCLIFPFLYSLK